MIPLAHSARNGRPPQLYGEHVAGVVCYASKNVRAISPYVDDKKIDDYLDIVTAAATYHDLGKLNSQNQDILHEKVKEKHLLVEHRDAGVSYLLNSIFKDPPVEYPPATLIYAHHYPGLPNVKEEKAKSYL